MLFVILMFNQASGLEYQGEQYHFIKNIQGDIIGILDSDSNQIVTSEYDSWGKVLSGKDDEGNIITNQDNIGNINSFRYRGYYYDTEIELYYLNSRYYNPEWGRFLNTDIGLVKDKTLLGNNLYIYVGNNPVNRIDPSGMFFKEIGNFFKNVGKTIRKATVTVKNAFVFEAGVGAGTGAGVQIGPVKVQASFSKDFGIGINNGKKYENTTSSAAIKTEITKNFQAGIGVEINHINDGIYENGNYHDNPMVMFHEIWDCPNTSKSILMGFDYKESGSTEMSNDGIFIGIAFDLHVVVGGHVKIGFNIK